MLTTLQKAWLTPLPLIYGQGSILATRLENNSYHLFSLETSSDKQSGRIKMLSFKLELAHLKRLEQSQVMAEECCFDVPGTFLT